MEVISKKLLMGRCDFFLRSIEPVHGAAAVGSVTFTKDIDSIFIPGIPGSTFHLFVAKTSPRAYELLTKVNQAIIKLQGTGKANEIYKKYLPTGDGL